MLVSPDLFRPDTPSRFPSNAHLLKLRPQRRYRVDVVIASCRWEQTGHAAPPSLSGVGQIRDVVTLGFRSRQVGTE